MFHQYLQRLAAYTVYRGSRFLKRTPPPLRHFATETLVHEPASKGSYPPPVTLDGQIERATGNLWEPLDDIIRYATQIDQYHKETLLHRIDNVTIDNGFLYKGARAEYFSSLGPPKMNKTRQEKEGVLVSPPAGALYFGCWVYGDNLLDGIADKIGQKAVKIMPHKNYFHLLDLNKLLHLSNNYIESPTTFDHLYMPEDIGYNQDKINRIRQLRARYNKDEEIGSTDPKYVYLARGANANARILSNEQEVTSYLKTIGFKIINPEEMTVSELVTETSDSDIVIGVEGSQLTYGLLGLKDGGHMLQLMPPWHFQATDRPRCESVGVRWGFLVGIENERGFELPLDDIKQLLEKVM